MEISMSFRNRTFLLFALIVTFPHHLHSMFLQAPSDSAFKQYRKGLDAKVGIDGKNIFSIIPLTKDEEGYLCEQYALAKILGGLVLPIPEVRDYFKQVRFPLPGDLVRYTKNELDFSEHLAFIDKDNRITSKWGDVPYKIKHGLFALPKSCGNRAGYFRLKPPYDTNKKVCILFMNRDGEANLWRKLRDVGKHNTPAIDLLLSVSS